MLGGGQSWTGSKTCASGLTCETINQWYSQCVPNKAGGNTGTTPPPITGDNDSKPPTTKAGNTLHDKFKAKGKLYFGTEIDHYHLQNNALTTIVKREFGQVTAENSMKWDAIERELSLSLESW